MAKVQWFAGSRATLRWMGKKKNHPLWSQSPKLQGHLTDFIYSHHYRVTQGIGIYFTSVKLVITSLSGFLRFVCRTKVKWITFKVKGGGGSNGKAMGSQRNYYKPNVVLHPEKKKLSAGYTWNLGCQLKSQWDGSTAAESLYVGHFVKSLTKQILTMFDPTTRCPYCCIVQTVKANCYNMTCKVLVTAGVLVFLEMFLNVFVIINYNYSFTSNTVLCSNN